MNKSCVALIAALAACSAEPNSPSQPVEVPGGGETEHVPIEQPSALAAREAERLTIDQISASFETILGQPWVVILDDGSPLPVNRYSPLYGALGGADYRTRLAEAMDPHLLFAKLILQGAWIACDEAARIDEVSVRDQRRLTRLDDPLENARDLKLRFHGIRANDADLEPYLELYRAAANLPGNRAIDGWRAVCVALVTEPEFVLY